MSNAQQSEMGGVDFDVAILSEKMAFEIVVVMHKKKTELMQTYPVASSARPRG